MPHVVQRVRISNAAGTEVVVPLELTALNALPVAMVDGTGAQITAFGGATPATTATTSAVADNAASTTILASNANRLGASVFNDSSAALYLLLGSGTASATNYTCRVASGGYYEVPFGYTGQINGIWASDPNDGAARVTELT